MNKEQRDLIESVIRQHPLYKGHEGLMELFSAEIYKKSYLLLNSVSNIASLKNYLIKVADTAIANVIKESADIKLPYVSISDNKKQPVERSIQEQKLPQLPEKKSSLIVSLHKNSKIEDVEDAYMGLIDPDEFFPEKHTSDTVAKNIIHIIERLDAAYPNEKYADIFNLRYIQKMHQSAIARKLKISQADLSKKFYELVRLIKQQLG